MPAIRVALLHRGLTDSDNGIAFVRSGVDMANGRCAALLALVPYIRAGTVTFRQAAHAGISIRAQ